MIEWAAAFITAVRLPWGNILSPFEKKTLKNSLCGVIFDMIRKLPLQNHRISFTLETQKGARKNMLSTKGEKQPFTARLWLIFKVKKKSHLVGMEQLLTAALALASRGPSLLKKYLH